MTSEHPTDDTAGTHPTTESTEPTGPPPGFTFEAGPGSELLVPEAYARWDPVQQRGYLARRLVNAAEGRTVQYAYDCVRIASERDPDRDPWESAAGMIGAAMALSRHGATRLISTAVEFIERLPRTAALLRNGWIGLHAAHTIADETALVEDAMMPEIDRRICEGLAPTRRRTHPPHLGPLRKMLSKTINKYDPVGADARAEASRRDLDVETVPLQGDRVLLSATLTVEDALEISQRLESLVRSAGRDDPRSIGQLRAAGLLAMSRGWTCLPDPDGEHPGDPNAQAAARRVVIHAYDDGSEDNRGISLYGYGPITRHTAEQLERSARVRIDELEILADPESAAAGRYAPSEALARFCRGRDGNCVFPGCQGRAEHADLDHIIPFDHDDPARGGRTTSDDLACLCRTHHRLKTDGVWSYFRDVDGSYVWLHGPNHPAPDTGTRIITTPSGPLAHLAAPRHPERSRQQQEAAEAGRTGGSASGTTQHRRPHLRERREAERSRRRERARQRRQDATRTDRATRPQGDEPGYADPPF